VVSALRQILYSPADLAASVPLISVVVSATADDTVIIPLESKESVPFFTGRGGALQSSAEYPPSLRGLNVPVSDA
jgi:hypothetical protein